MDEVHEQVDPSFTRVTCNRFHQGIITLPHHLPVAIQDLIIFILVSILTLLGHALSTIHTFKLSDLRRSETGLYVPYDFLVPRLRPLTRRFVPHPQTTFYASGSAPEND